MMFSLFWDTVIIYHAVLFFSVSLFAASAFLYGVYVYGKIGLQTVSSTLEYGARRSVKGKKSIVKKYRRSSVVLRAVFIALRKKIRVHIDRIKKEVFIDE